MRAYRYRLPFSEPVPIAGTSHAFREGLLISTERGWGEAAPLPGFSRETLGEVITELRTGPPFFAPSLRFAWDAANSMSTSISVPVNALLSGSADDIMRACRRLADSPCRAVKLKVGRLSLESEVALVHEVRECLRADQQLRLDANRAWSFEQAVRFGRAVVDQDIEYVEEPLLQPELCERLLQQTGLPYALDETLSETGDLAAFPNLSALVVKPTQLGGVADIQRLACYGKPMVLTACFESGVGTAHVAQLAQRFCHEVPVGLDTYSRLGADVLRERLPLDDWRLAVNTPLEVERDRLIEVAAWAE